MQNTIEQNTPPRGEGSSRRRLTIRIGRSNLSFAYQAGQNPDIAYEPYVVRSGVSMAANLREAFKTSGLLTALDSDQGAQAWPPLRTMAALDSDVMMVPIEQFDENEMERIYTFTFPANSHDAVCYDVLPDLNAVAVFAVNRDLRLVLNDHFTDIRLMTVMGPVWRHLHQRSFTGRRQKLYAYFHEKRMELFAFRQNRFKFCNTFEATRTNDALYFLLYVWKHLQLLPEQDELHMVGTIPDEQQLVDTLHRYLQNVYVINPAADFNNHPVTAIKDIPYDLMTLYARGR